MLNVIFTIPRKYTLLVDRLKVNRRTYNFVSRADLTGCEVSYCFILLTLQADPLAPIRWSRYNSDKRETCNPRDPQKNGHQHPQHPRRRRRLP
jgi:hypothetical protein